MALRLRTFLAPARTSCPGVRRASFVYRTKGRGSPHVISWEAQVLPLNHTRITRKDTPKSSKVGGIPVTWIEFYTGCYPVSVGVDNTSRINQPEWWG